MNKFIDNCILEETKRQNNGIELIASENYVSKDVLKAMGSILTNKYAEGYPNARYYGGCEIIDKVEQYAIDKACELFNCKYANVQPHSGSQANYAAYRALMPDGGKVLSLELNDGGHLTHGSPVSFSSHTYKFCFYPLGADGKLDYEAIRKIAKKRKPNVILAGYSAYPYKIDWQKFRDICDEVGAYFMVDMAHIAGLVAAGVYDNPCKYADIVTSTTHKTLRGPRGGLILSNNESLFKKINSAVFPYSQGGPLEHIIAAKSICFDEALKPSFKRYAEHVIENTKACAQMLKTYGATVSETDTHLFLLNTISSYNLTGLEAQKKLEQIGITTNKNMIPGDRLSPKETSGLRIGFAAVTTRGCTKAQAAHIASIIYMYLGNYITKEQAIKQVKAVTKNWNKIS